MIEKFESSGISERNCHCCNPQTIVNQLTQTTLTCVPLYSIVAECKVY